MWIAEAGECDLATGGYFLCCSIHRLPFHHSVFFAPEPALFHTNDESEQHRAGGLKASGFGRHPRNAKAQSQRNPRLAPKVKRLAIEVGGTIVKPNLEVEWATALWLDGRRVPSGLGTSQWNTNQVAMSHGAERVGEGWPSKPIAEILRTIQEKVKEKWEPLKPNPPLDASQSWEALVVCTWNLGA